METKTDLSVRGEHTSASNAQADLLCKARHLAQKGIPSPESAEATHGSLIHEALKLQKPDGLNLEQEKTYEACNELDQRAVAAFFPELGNALALPTREVRYWIKWADGLSHSGQLDALYVSGKRALIVEYKTLPGDVPTSPSNMQLRDQACLAYFNTKGELDEIGVMVNQPLVTRTPEITIYNRESLDRASAEMYFRVRASNTPGQNRTPGEAQCKYCLAKDACREYNAFAGGMVVQPDSPVAASLIASPITQWTPEMQAVFLERLPVAEKWLTECKSVLKKLLKENPNAIPGFTLSNPRNLVTITDPQAVFTRFQAAGGSLDEFMKCVEVGKTKLDLAVRAATKLKGKSADAKLTEIIGDSMTIKPTEPSIIKSK